MKKFDLELKMEMLEEKLEELEDKFPMIGKLELELEFEQKMKKLKFGKTRLLKVKKSGQIKGFVLIKLK